MADTPTNTKDKRVAFEVPPEIAPDFSAIATKIGVSNAGLGTLAAKFVIPLLKAGKLVNINNQLVPVEQAADFLKKQAAKAA